MTTERESGLSQRWRERANERCSWCKTDWDLGAHGCHFEPIPQTQDPDEYGSVTENCKAFGLRQRTRELDAAKLRIEKAVKALPRYGFWRDYELITREAVLKIIREIL